MSEAAPVEVGPKGASAVLSAARRGLLVAVDVLLPPSCLVCRTEVDQHGSLCSACWSGLHFLNPPWCRCCGHSLPDSGAADPLCGDCVVDPPLFNRARAALRYDETGRLLILRFKHRERIEAVRTFARWMKAAGAGLLETADLLVPVPLDRRRLVQRGFNQAALLARELVGGTPAAFAPHLLIKCRRTLSQQGLDARQRRANVTAESFKVRETGRARLEGARIVLVDDVLTTGATVSACCRVLSEAGAERVDVLTLARAGSPRGRS